jgi:hypothetical protein
MSSTRKHLPTVVLPLSEECDRPKCQDIFVYLRPESNGIVVESAIMRAISRRTELNGRIKLVYLANLPGDFLSRSRVIEKHYQLKLLFTRAGGKLFTSSMKEEFSRYFGIPFDKARVAGAFEAMRILGMNREELFDLWVAEKDLLHLNGQTIKRYHNLFIVNYDIPAILQKNSSETDIAVMIFRSELAPEEFHHLITDMVTILRKDGIVDTQRPFSRVFHYSNGPFEQIRDGLGFLYDKNGNHLPLEHIRFYRYLIRSGLTRTEILKVLEYPLFVFGDDEDRHREETIYAATLESSYPEARKVLLSARAQLLLGSGNVFTSQ